MSAMAVRQTVMEQGFLACQTEDSWLVEDPRTAASVRIPAPVTQQSIMEACLELSQPQPL